ncbi:galactokinase [Marinococcus halophilus]|uniref:Galactokinase n=1 Tax=Marinococcus halophilus TaxID=1371 RepID=A0A510Y6D3_MARHA|nr:galactokinase [Marinococcus halophilus]OZT80558.1 galactokinase [Marinococcus halophilus]GEK58912.1 galactokinase [Marinococcus halophilus]
MNRAVLEEFEQQYSRQAERLFFAPGRINVIGEHTDYNGGFVFPCAITNGTYAAAAGRNDRQLRLVSGNFLDKGVIALPLDDLSFQPEDDWANYPKGVFAVLAAEGYYPETGYDIYFSGNIPNGAGLSSSASIELATAVLLNECEGWGLSMKTLVQYAQQVENKYIGVQTGIMDQFAIGFGKDGHAMLLDCASLEYDYAPLPTKKYTILIMNTNKSRELAGSAYNERRAECEEALAEMQQHRPITGLCELSVEEWNQLSHEINNETVRKRARHVIYEHDRTKQAVEMLKAENYEAFGRLLNESHRSLKEDYEVTGLELDTLAETAQQQPGVIGARMTGAGFGGCAIAFVEHDQAEEAEKIIAAVYEKETGRKASFYKAAAGGGARELAGAGQK